MSWTRSKEYRTTFFRLLAPNSSEKILDVGAGKGAVAALVQRTGSSEVYALDPNGKRIEIIKKNYPDLRTCQSGSESIPYSDGFFDKVYSTAAFHHFRDQQKSIRELARVLKPDGLLVILEIAPQSLLGRLGRFWENGILRAHLGFLSLEEMTTLVCQEGRFEIKETQGNGAIYFVQAMRTRLGAR